MSKLQDMAVTGRELREVVRAIRSKRGLTQHTFAAKTDGVMSASYIGMVESGQRGMRQDKIDAIREVLPLTNAEYKELSSAAEAFHEAVPTSIQRVTYLEEEVAEVKTLLQAIAAHLDVK